ncbi:MAG: HAMP domain-containing protein [Myxococcales bacterium]|nr:HAMP domain-containing protein [Myxococcales bacterium]
MRLGVSGKIFLAYTALAAMLVGSSVLTLVYMHRTRARVVASQALFDVQLEMDAAWRKLNDFPKTATRRPDPTRPLLFVQADERIEAALAAIALYGEDAPGLPGAPDFARFTDQIRQLREELAHARSKLGAFEATEDAEERRRFTSDLTNLTYRLDRLKRVIRRESRRIAAELRADEEAARSLAMLLGLGSAVVAVMVALSMMRTLRPLRVLRQQAREVAGGHYDRRLGVASRDEIGELAREFDAMAIALQERENRLIQSERLATIGRMASQIAHEIRNPLASIGLNAELLGDEVQAGDEEARRLVSSIAREVDRLSEITESYLRFVRLPQARREREDLGSIVHSVVAFSRAELERAGVKVSVNVALGLPDVIAGEAQLRQALLNLVRNAMEAMPDGGALTLTLQRRGEDQLALEVCDSGPGIPAELVDKIFDPFFTTKERGTGLGLALVQQIVVEHGGSIEVRSAEGTCFVVTFPVAPAASRPPGVSSEGEGFPVDALALERS